MLFLITQLVLHSERKREELKTNFNVQYTKQRRQKDTNNENDKKDRAAKKVKIF